MAHENTDLFSCITPRKNGVNYSVSVREQKYTVQIVWIETPTNQCVTVFVCVCESDCLHCRLSGLRRRQTQCVTVFVCVCVSDCLHCRLSGLKRRQTQQWRWSTLLPLWRLLISGLASVSLSTTLSCRLTSRCRAHCVTSLHTCHQYVKVNKSNVVCTRICWGFGSHCVFCDRSHDSDS